MLSTAITTLAVFGATAMAKSVGNAVVVNKCTYPVYLNYVPAAFGGAEESDKWLQSGDSWTERWTGLSNGNGWSIKLSKSQDLSNIMQYEYTFHDDGTIWYDLSDVNGNPWDGDWEFTASDSTCNPLHQAYRYSTDDAYGMQSCPQGTSITVTLCSGESQNDGLASSISSSVAAETTQAPSSTYQAPASTQESSTQEHQWGHGHGWNKAAAMENSPTTFATVSTTETPAVTQAPDGNFVVEMETAIVTEVVTAYAKRHDHHPHGHAA